MDACLTLVIQAEWYLQVILSLSVDAAELISKVFFKIYSIRKRRLFYLNTEGDSSKLYDCVHSKIFTLPDDYKVYPAHDYTGIMKTFFNSIKFYRDIIK